KIKLRKLTKPLHIVGIQEVVEEERDDEVVLLSIRLERRRTQAGLRYRFTYCANTAALRLRVSCLVKNGRDLLIARDGTGFAEPLVGHQRMARVPDFETVRVTDNLDRRTLAVTSVHHSVHDRFAYR